MYVCFEHSKVISSPHKYATVHSQFRRKPDNQSFIMIVWALDAQAVAYENSC